MNERPHRTEIRKRVAPSRGGGYDFHKSFRRLAHRYLVGEVPIADVLAAADMITRSSERQSALAALERLDQWRASAAGEIVAVPPIVFESPSHLFRVKFEADFGMQRGGGTVAVHLWNTMKPVLAPGPTYAALTLVAQAFQTQENAPNDIAVLSIREPPRLFRLSDVADQATLAASIVDQLEETIRGAGPPPPPPPPSHPSPQP